MKVLFWQELFWPYIGGAEIFAADLINSLQDRGFEFLLITRQDDPGLAEIDQYRGISIRRFPFWPVLSERNLASIFDLRQRLHDLIGEFRPDMIHVQSFGPSLWFLLEEIKKQPIPILTTLIDEWTYDKTGLELFRRLLTNSTYTTAKSTYVLEQARELVPTITPRSSVIFNGIKIPLIEPKPLPITPAHLLCIGRLAKQKGFDVAITAFKGILETVRDAHLTIAGDGPERSALESKIHDFGLTEKVTLVGWIKPDSVIDLINSATIVLMPSRWEGLPSVALQSGVMARPIIASGVSGLSEVILNGQTGILIQPDEAESITTAALFLLNNEEIAREFGWSARKRVIDIFNWDQCVTSYERLYRMYSGAVNSNQ